MNHSGGKSMMISPMAMGCELKRTPSSDEKESCASKSTRRWDNASLPGNTQSIQGQTRPSRPASHFPQLGGLTFSQSWLQSKHFDVVGCRRYTGSIRLNPLGILKGPQFFADKHSSTRLHALLGEPSSMCDSCRWSSPTYAVRLSWYRKFR